MQPSSSVIFVGTCGSSLLWLVIVGDGSAAALFDDAGGSLLSFVSILSLTLDPVWGGVPTVTSGESDFSSTFLPSAPGFSLASWLMGRGGSTSQCRPSYPANRSSEMAKKYANGARIKDPTRKTETGAEAKIHCFNFVPRCHSHFRAAKKALSNHLKIHRGAQNQHSQSAKARAQHKSTHPANAPRPLRLSAEARVHAAASGWRLAFQFHGSNSATLWAG